MKTIIFLFIIHSTSCFAGATGEVLADTAKGAVVGGAVGYATTKVGQAAIEGAAPGFTEEIGKFFDSPQGIVAMAGISTIYSTMLYNAAEEQEKAAENNIKKVDKIIKSYTDSWAAYCPNGRNKLEEPSCYCYLETGLENKSRSNSQICQDLWNKNKYTLDGAATDYRNATLVNDPVGCVAVDGQFDENCKCKKLVDAKGKNACMKAVSISIPSGFATALAGSTGLKDVMRVAANASNGNPNLNSFNNGAMGLKAIANDRLTSGLISKLGGGLGKGSPVYANENNVNSIAKSMFGEKAMLAAIANSKPLSDYSTSALNPKSNQILNEMKQKNSLEMVGSGNGLGNKKSNKKAGFELNFGDSGSSGSTQQVVQDFPEKNYKFKNSDIQTDKDASIFEIISNRYIQSGLKRLFEE